MLPSFPKSQKILDEEWQIRMFAAKAEVFPTAFHPPVHHIIEGRQTDFQREDRQVRPLEMKKHSFTTSHDIKDGKGMTLEIFELKAKELGEQFGKQMWQTLADATEKAVAETGNELKIKIGALTEEDFFKMLEMGEKDFDEAGRPTGKLFCDPSLAEELRTKVAEWSRDPGFNSKV